MIVNDKLVFDRFIYWCNEYFGSLMFPRLELTNDTKKLGYYSYKLTPDGHQVNRKMAISKIYDYTQQQFDSILVHEMIHYFLSDTGRDMKLTHGAKFMEIANELNNLYGLKIGEYADLTEEYKFRKDMPYWKIKMHQFFSSNSKFSLFLFGIVIFIDILDLIGLF